MVEWLPDATLAIDTEGKVVAWNRAMEELTGIKAEDMLGKGNYEYSLAFYNTKRPIMVDVVLKPEEISRYYSLVEVNNYTVISEFPTPHLRQDSHNLWGRAMPWYDKDGKILGAIECLRDITERYQYTDGLNKQLDKNQKDIQHLYSVLNNLDSSLISCTGGGNIKFVSDNLSQRLGYDSGELSGRKLSDFMTPKSSRELKDSLKAAVPSAINICLVHKDGSKHDVAMEIKPLPPEGRTKNYMLLVKDI
jgi:PAS domain S-box-containing protein